MIFSLIRPYLENEHLITFKRGDIIYHEGDKPTDLYFIHSGLVGLFHVNESGKETFLRVFGKDYILGHRSYFAEENYHGSSIALSKIEIYKLTTQKFESICEQHKDLSRSMIKILARDLGQAELRLAGFKDKSATSRIIEALVYLKLRYPEHTWTRKEIAEYSGSTYETVTRVMTKLESAQMITKKGRDYNFSDGDALLEYAQGLD